MHKQIEKQVLKQVNAVLKKQDCKVILAQGSKARYIVQRRALSKIGSPFYAIGLAYGEALLDVLKDDTMRVNDLVGANGWYGNFGFNGETYLPVQLSAEEVEQLETLLA